MNDANVPTTAVLGGGTMGPGIVAMLAARGVDVHWLVRDPARHAAARTALDAACESQQVHGSAGTVTLHTALEAMPLQAMGLVIETVTEDLPLKRTLFAQVETLCDAHTVIASNSSSFPISQIAAGMRHPERALGLHFFMPAHLVPLVEVIRGEHSDAAIAERVGTWMTALGKRPVQVRRDVTGFLGNRMQAALMREALWLIEQGVADAADIDAAVRFSFGFRYAAAGPVLQKEHSGWDTTCAVAKVIYPTLCNADGPPPVLQALVDAGRTGMKRGAGFFPWSADDIAVERARYERAMQRCLAIFRDEGVID